MMKAFAVGMVLGGVMTLGLAPADAKTRQERREAAIAAAKPAGDPVSCIPLNQIRETRVRSDTIIDFIMDGRKAYRVTLPNSCPGLGFEERFSYKTSLSQLCSTDIITVLRTGGPGLMPGASCGLSEFQPVTGVK
ncbi:hypothetical protein [Sphingomonas sp. ID0503]|uniref:hypothetical protein n=1 Tax=Sphingomonas sp. ID0503 TaxID=3399691 RepID=UPI003AFA4D00